MPRVSKLEAFLCFARDNDHPTTLYRVGQPVGVYVNGTWCYLEYDKAVPQSLQQLYEQFCKALPYRKRKRVK